MLSAGSTGLVIGMLYCHSDAIALPGYDLKLVTLQIDRSWSIPGLWLAFHASAKTIVSQEAAVNSSAILRGLLLTRCTIAIAAQSASSSVQLAGVADGMDDYLLTVTAAG